MNVQQIPIEQLTRSSAHNVRKSGGKSITELAASIRAHGLLQSLVAIPGVAGTFEVVAGGRRLAAMEQLVNEGHFKQTDTVPVRVIDAEVATEASLAENIVREAMRPTDQFKAFRALLDRGEPEADVAARFGVTTLFLRQRMKLAKLSESVLEALETGEISLQQAEAFTLSDDQDVQDEVFQNFDPQYDDADDIRAMFRRDQVRPTDPRAKFVGVAAYEKAGGTVIRDLFAEKEAGYLGDEKLLDELVLAKLEKSAKSVRAEGWAFVEVGPKVDEYRFQRLFGDQIDKASAGAIVKLSDQGKVEILRGYLKPGQKLVTDRETGKTTATAPPVNGKDVSKLSAAATVRLQGFRTAVLQCEVRKNQRFALAALAASLASKDMLHGYLSVDQLVRISRGNSMGVQMASTEGTTFQELEDAEAMWLDRLPDGGEESVLSWLLANPEQMTLDLLAHLSSRAIREGQLDVDPGREFAKLAGIDLADHWKVTAEWLAQQPTGYIIAAVTEAHGKKAGEAVGKCKGKAAIVAAAAQQLDPSGPGGKVWLPEPLREPATKKAKVAKTAKAAVKAASKKRGSQEEE